MVRRIKECFSILHYKRLSERGQNRVECPFCQVWILHCELSSLLFDEGPDLLIGREAFIEGFDRYESYDSGVLDLVLLPEKRRCILSVPHSLDCISVAHLKEASWHGTVRGESKDNVSEITSITVDELSWVFLPILFDSIASWSISYVLASDRDDVDFLFAKSIL